MQIIDARGLSCPEPVLRVQKALQKDAAGAEVLVGNRASVENINRYAVARGYAFSCTEDGDHYHILLKKL